MMPIRIPDYRSCAQIAMLVLWASTTFSIALMEIAFVCALLFWIGWHIQLRKESGGFPLTRQACLAGIDWMLWLPLALFLIEVLLSLALSEYPKQSFQGVLKVAKPILAFFMASRLFQNTASQKYFRWIFLAVFLVLIIDSSVQYAFGRDFIRGFAAVKSRSGLRLVGPFGNFAKMATYLVLVVPVFTMCSLSDFIKKGGRSASFYTFSLSIAGAVLLYLTRCRGAMIGLAVAFFILFFYKRWWKVLGLGILLCFMIVAVMPKAMIFHYDITNKEQSLRERYRLWKRALDVIEAKPLTGTGINTYNVAHAKYDKEKHWRVRGYYAHNGYLQLAAEIGLPGIFCFLWFLFMFFRRTLQAVVRVRGSPEEYIQLGLVTGLMAFLFYAAGDNNLQSPPSLMMFWYLAGILRARQSISMSLPKVEGSVGA